MAQLLLVMLLSALAAAAAGDVDGCNQDKMTVYKMVLHTYWTREKFPKHYPDWRPAAQWSKIYGVTHDATYVLFRLGRRVSSAVREFAETGRSDALGSAPGTLDVFGGPAVGQGMGRTEVDFFVDGNHSRVSVMTRMVPSPDWFIGVDSFDLCVDGNWLDSITIEVDPLDAGTDNGFTFTAPNWPTAPQGVAYRITSKYPSHPAGSFFYPHLRRLPPIATFQFIKLREYELSEVFHRNTDDKSYDILQLDKMNHNNIDVLDGNRALSIAEEAERVEQAPRIYSEGSMTTQDDSYSYYSITKTTSSTTEEPRSANELPTSAPVASERTALKSLARRYRARRRRKFRTDHTDPAERKKRKKSRMLDCRVSEWSEWSPCRSDGGCVGSAMRTRRILRQQRPGGAPCPPTALTRWCATNCTLQNMREDWRNNLTTKTTSTTTEEPRSANELPTSAPVASERTVLKNLPRRYRARRRRKFRTDNIDPAERKKRKNTRMLDCRVSAWSEWGPCRSDGGCVGSSMRTRRILRKQRPGGAPCPSTELTRWCATNCTKQNTREGWRNNLT